MNILVTGGAGYIGSHVSYLLIEKGYNVTIIDNLSTGNKKIVPKKAKLIKCDIADVKKVKKLINKKKFELVLHFAGLIRVDESVKYPKKYIQNNYNKSKVFIDNCISCNLKNLIFSSTAAVYGNPKKNRVDEKDKLKPLNPYAKSKLMIEKFIINRAKERNLKYIILRYLLKNKKSNIFNCGYGKGYSVKEILYSTNNILKKNINYTFGPRRPGDSGYIVSNPNKFKKITGWKPKNDNIKKIILSAIQWEKKLS